MQVTVFRWRGRGVQGKVWHLNFLDFFGQILTLGTWKLITSGEISPQCYEKSQFGCGKKKSPEGIEEESKCNTYDRPSPLHLNIITCK